MIQFLSEHTAISRMINIAVIIITCIGILKIWQLAYQGSSRKIGNSETLHKKFIGQLVKGIIIIIAVYMVLEQIPTLSSTASLIATNASLMVAVLGFAAQEALGDIINGLFISMFKPFEIGDRVRLVSHNITGNIESITLRHVVIQTVENKRLVVPNSVINKELIENADFKDDAVCNFLDVTISYESNVDKAIGVLTKVIREHKYFVDYRTEEDKVKGEPEVKILIRELGDHGINLRCHIWTMTIPQNFQMCSDIRMQILKEFGANGIEIPYPHLKIVGEYAENN